MYVTGTERVTELRCHCLGFGYFLRLQPLALEHVHEIGVAAEIELISAIKPHAAFAKQIRQHPMRDRGTHLRLDVVTNDRQTPLLETVLPIFLRRNEDWNAIDEGAARLEHLFDIPFRGHFRTDRQIIHHHIGSRFFQNANDVISWPRRFFDDVLEILTHAVMSHAAMDFDAEALYFSEPNCVVGLRRNCFTEIATDFRHVDIKRGAELNVAWSIAAKFDVHQAGRKIVCFRSTIKLHALHQRRGAVSNADNSNADFTAAILFHTMTSSRRLPVDTSSGSPLANL